MIASPTHALDPVDVARAGLYRLLAHTLIRAPDAALLARMAALTGDDTQIGGILRDVAATATAPSVDWAIEYDVVFIGVARGEVLPYASYYLTGFLNERPLARLRADMARLGVARVDHSSDPEDHIGTVCDLMASLIERADPDEAGFFARHLAPWATAFFTDLGKAASARLYRPIGQLGALLIDLDRQGFAYAAEPTLARGAA